MRLLWSGVVLLAGLLACVQDPHRRKTRRLARRPKDAEVAEGRRGAQRGAVVRRRAGRLRLTKSGSGSRKRTSGGCSSARSTASRSVSPTPATPGSNACGGDRRLWLRAGGARQHASGSTPGYGRAGEDSGDAGSSVGCRTG